MRYLAALFVLAAAGMYAAMSAPLDAVQQPKRFTKHGEVWTIRYVGIVDADSVNDAMTWCPFKRVDVRQDIKGQNLNKALMHEVMHVLACDGALAHDQRWNNSGDKDDGYEGHEGVYWGSEELLAFIQENPEFIAFLQQSGK